MITWQALRFPALGEFYAYLSEVGCPKAAHFYSFDSTYHAIRYIIPKYSIRIDITNANACNFIGILFIQLAFRTKLRVDGNPITNMIVPLMK
jgi:hypothetical protein